MEELRKMELRPHGITTAEALALFSIESIGNVATPAEISRRMFRKPHTVSTLLLRMENRGLVNRDHNLNRENLVGITLTDKGQRDYRASLKRESIHRVISSLSEEERRQLVACLEKLRETASQLGLEWRLKGEAA